MTASLTACDQKLVREAHQGLLNPVPCGDEACDFGACDCFLSTLVVLSSGYAEVFADGNAVQHNRVIYTHSGETMNVTAIITARDLDSCAERKGAVDATIYADGIEVGEVTLLEYEGGEGGSGLGAWGGLDNWASHKLTQWLQAGDDSAEARTEAIFDAVLAAS